jgi:hypothetical protein
MRAEGWRHMDEIAGNESTFDEYWWLHPPTRQSVTIAQSKRRQWIGPVWGNEPESTEADGYCVTLRTHDQWGNPIQGDGFWIASFGHAVKLGREIRRAVLVERPIPTARDQLNFDDLLERQKDSPRLGAD